MVVLNLKNRQRDFIKKNISIKRQIKNKLK